MSKKDFMLANNGHFAETYYYRGHYQTKTRIHLTSYNKDLLETNEIDTNTECFTDLIKKDCINWFEVQGLSDASTINRIVREFGMHKLDVRDILTPGHVVKIDDDNQHIVVIMNNCRLTKKNKIDSDHTSIIICENNILTFTESNNPIFENVYKGLQTNTMDIRQDKSGMLLAFLLNSILVDLIEIASYIENRLEEIEDVLLQNHYRQQSIGSQIQNCRHACLMMRKNTQPLKNDFSKITKPKKDIIDEALLPVFNDLEDQLEYIIQTNKNSKDILSSLVELYVSNNDLKTNAIMKRLTVVSTLFIPITFLVGLWGMNFEIMPELKWKYGYLFSWAIIVGTAIATWIFMKKKKWF